MLFHLKLQKVFMTLNKDLLYSENICRKGIKAQNGLRELSKLEVNIRATARNPHQSLQIGFRAFFLHHLHQSQFKTILELLCINFSKSIKNQAKFVFGILSIIVFLFSLQTYYTQILFRLSGQRFHSHNFQNYKENSSLIIICLFYLLFLFPFCSNDW